MSLVDEHAGYTALMAPGEHFGVLLGALRQRRAWMADALCATYPEVEFVPPPGRSNKPPTALEEAALAVCRRCPVVEDCLAFAIAADEVGVWGATTERQRREIRRAA